MVIAKTHSSIEEQKRELALFKYQLSSFLAPTATSDARSNAGRDLLNNINANERLLEKADATVQRLKLLGRVPSRSTASGPASERAKRALSILSAADPGFSRSVRQKPSRSRYLTLAGKPPATPIKEEDVLALCARASTLAPATKVTMIKTGAIIIERPNIFRAYMWLKEAPPPSDVQVKLGAKSGYVVPEHVSCFRTDEFTPRYATSQWSCSKHAVFNVMTERAQAAIRYFMAREHTGEDAFMELVLWLINHNNLFSDECDGRRLAFDASRGIFLPPCVHPFDGSGRPRFTRGTIPVRNSSAQPTVKIPHPSSHHQAAHQGTRHDARPQIPRQRT